MRNPAKDKQSKQRRGVTAPFLAILLVPMLGMVAFAVDYGYLAMVRSDLQRTADASVLAAAQDLIPSNNGTQDLAKVRARLREYVAANLGTANDGLTGSFAVRDEDIVIERYDPATIYSGNIQFLQGGIKDTVRVTLRRDTQANSPVQLFFARVLGIGEQSVEATATAVLRRGEALKVDSDVLPFAIHVNTWDALAPDSIFNIYDDNKVRTNSGETVAGNWGTIDLGYNNNSTSDLSDQIIKGLRDTDVMELFNEGRIPTREEVRAPLYAQGEPGLSVGMKHSVFEIYGQRRIIPLYNSVNDLTGDNDFTNNPQGQGNNAEFHIVKWGVVQVVDSKWNGNKKTYISAIKAYTYDGALVAREDLSNVNTDMPGAFTSPVLVQ